MIADTETVVEIITRLQTENQNYNRLVKELIEANNSYRERYIASDNKTKDLEAKLGGIMQPYLDGMHDMLSIARSIKLHVDGVDPDCIKLAITAVVGALSSTYHESLASSKKLPVGFVIADKTLTRFSSKTSLTTWTTRLDSAAKFVDKASAEVFNVGAETVVAIYYDNNLGYHI